MFIHDKTDPAAKDAKGRDPKIERALVQADIAKGLKVVERILDSSDAKFASRSFLLEQCLEFGLSRQPWKNWSRFTRHMNSSRFGLQQWPTEFVDYLMFVSRLGIGTAAELGVFLGGSSYFAAAVLQRANPDLVYTMVDIRDRLIGFPAFSKLLTLDKRIPMTSSQMAREAFDLVFIDADHSYMGSKLDWLNLGRSARKAVAFHDIHGHSYSKKYEGGIVRTWAETKEVWMDSHALYEFAHSPQRWMGIGLAVRTDAPG